MIRFTVVIPTLHSPFIDQTLDSLRAQRYDLSHVEVIVVGQDQYGLVQEDELVRFDCSSVPLAPAVARNRGIKQASGDVIAFLDADCIASPTWLAVLAERYQDSEVYVVGGGVAFPNDDYWTTCDNLSWFHEVLTSTPAGIRSHLPTLNFSLRREVVAKVGGIDESFPRPAGEDTEWTTRMRLAGYTLHFEPRATVYHYHRRNTLKQILEHAFYFGRYSVKVDPHYAAQEGLPLLLRTRVGLILCAPLLAAGATCRIFAFHRNLRRYWHTVPVVYVSKIAWCLGAATHPRGVKRYVQNLRSDSMLQPG